MKSLKLKRHWKNLKEYNVKYNNFTRKENRFKPQEDLRNDDMILDNPINKINYEEEKTEINIYEETETINI